MGIKELEPVAGWPYTEASLVFTDRVADHDSTQVTRLRAAGAVLAGQTTASEFGGDQLHPHQAPRDHPQPVGSRAHPGGLVGRIGGRRRRRPAARSPAAGDGGGSIRIPAGFTGLFGLKSTFGRIPKGPGTLQPPLTVVVGCVSRSVRDTARWFDVCNGFDPRDTLSLPRVEGWEAGLDSFDLAGKRAVISIDLGSAIVEPRAAALVIEAAEALIAAAGLTRVDVVVELPEGGLEWAMSNLVGLAGELGDRYPDCNDDLTPEIQLGHEPRHPPLQRADRRGRPRCSGSTVNEQMADLFERDRLRLRATNPDVAFAAAGPDAHHGRRRRPHRRVRLRQGHRQQRGADHPGQPHRQPGGVHPGRDRSTGCRSACRSSAATTRSSSCWTWPASPSASGPGRWWLPARARLTAAAAFVRIRRRPTGPSQTRTTTRGADRAHRPVGTHRQPVHHPRAAGR